MDCIVYNLSDLHIKHYLLKHKCYILYNQYIMHYLLNHERNVILTQTAPHSSSYKPGLVTVFEDTVDYECSDYIL